MNLLNLVHGLLALATPWLLLALISGFSLGCQIKSIEPEPAVVFQAESKDEAVRVAHEGKTLFDLKTNEGVATNITQSILGVTPRVIFQRDLLIAEKRIENEDIYLKLVTKQLDFTKDPPEENTYVDEATIPVNLSKIEACGSGPRSLASRNEFPDISTLSALKSISSTAKSEGDQPKTPFASIRELGKITLAVAEAQSVEPCEMCSASRVLDASIRVEYSNLKITKSAGLPPPAVVTNGCRGISPCRIKYTKINYDEIYSTPTISRRRYNCELVISPSVPYLSMLLSSCQSFLVNIDGQDIPIQACVQVADWQNGT
jgi:hypothetical protein